MARETRPAMPDETLSDRVFVWITEQIVAGHLRPGQWVSENELAARLGVSRSPVREALRGLAREGLVEVRPRRGTIIAELNAEDADDLYRTRQLVEAEMARLAIENASDEDVEQLAAIVEDLRRALDDAPAYYDATLRLWQLLMDICPSRTLRDMTAILWRRSIRFRGILLRLPGSQREVLAFADTLVQLARQRDGEGARAAMADVLGGVRRTLLEEVFIDVGGNGGMQRPLSRRHDSPSRP